MGFPTRSISFGAKYQKQIIQKGYYSFGAESVVISALYMALMAGYETILLAGIDADWIKHTNVDNSNRVYRVYKHSYDPKGVMQYLDISYTQALLSAARYFAQLQAIYEFASIVNTTIINVSQNSMVDIFPKKIFSDIAL